MAFLLQSGLAWRQRLSCEAIGRLAMVYNGEFGSFKFSISGMLSFLTGILQLGYVEAESKGIGVEVPVT